MSGAHAPENTHSKQIPLPLKMEELCAATLQARTIAGQVRSEAKVARPLPAGKGSPGSTFYPT